MESEGSFDYTGLDVTPSYLEAAKQRFALTEQQESRKFRFEQGTVFDLPFPDQSFDVVQMTGVLVHLPEVQRPLEEIFRVSSGFVLLGVPIHNGSQPEDTVVRNGMLYKTWSSDYILDQIRRLGTIESITCGESPHYSYQHCLIKARPNDQESHPQNRGGL